MKYYIEIHSNKPKEDVNVIARKQGYVNIGLNTEGSGPVTRFVTKLASMFYILAKMKHGDLLLIQYPMKTFYVMACIFAHIKKGCVITLVHDLGSFRRKKLTVEKENVRLSHSDYTIVHNPNMRDFLEHNGYKVKLYCLELFDYLSPAKPPMRSRANFQTVIYAGGVGYKRNPFLYKLDDHIHNWKMEIYGAGADESLVKGFKNIRFNGSLPPDELLAKAQGDFGLVWDGNSIDECSGAWGEYLKINNPHKTSFYLRAGLPVIIWEKAALAPFVRENKVGLCVDSLRDIDAVLSALTEDEYLQMKRNAENISKKVAHGYFTCKALGAAEKYLSGK